jgi:hypothetical protein
MIFAAARSRPTCIVFPANFPAFLIDKSPCR